MVEKVSALRHPEENEEEEEEEALSLCDLPLDENVNEFEEMARRRSSSEPPDLFEFLSSDDSMMCPAEDMIFCGGRLVSSSQPPIIDTLSRDDKRKQTAFRRRSESLPELKTSSSGTRSNNNSTRTGNSNNILRSSRSLDYQKLRRLSSSKSSHDDSDVLDRNPSVRKPDRAKPAARPRWYLLMFGMVKFPPEMDLRDIKSRQFRRHSSYVMFPPSADSSSSDGANSFSGHRGPSKASWRFLKALSCKDHASVAVTTPFYVPQV